MFEILQKLRTEVDDRVAEITTQYPDWPCRRGCSHCCRRLARAPELSEAEWQEVRIGVARLPGETQAAIAAREEELEQQAGPPFTCAFLEPVDGACLIYEHRPLACRTYGFYVDERGTGLYCGIIREKQEAGELAEAVWGNQSALEGRLESLGPRRR